MIYHILIIIGCAILCGFSFRLRGGGYFTFGTNVYCRLIWAGSFLAAFCLMNGFTLAALALFPLSYIALYIPDDYAQNSGLWPAPQNKWPTFWMGLYTQAEWDAMVDVERTLDDFDKMTISGWWRGATVFGGLSAVSYAAYHTLPTLGLGIAIASIGVLQALGYLAGRFMPLTLGASLPARSACWGEYFNGVAWVLAAVAYGCF